MKVARWDRTAHRFSDEKMQKVGLFSSERLFCDLYCLEPGQSQKPHTHRGSDKVYLVVEGEGTFRVGDEERRLGEGEATMADAGELHGILNESGARLVVLTLMTPPPS
jgi:mannose-6-phosphate isomerase-like protein (cupin superfamily)